MNYPTYLNYPRMDMGQPMQQMQNMQQFPVQNVQSAQMQQPNYVTRPVTSREEAVAVQVDVFGLGTLMPDISHGVIYLKRFNPNTGGSDFLTFAVREEPKQPNALDMRREFENVYSEIDHLKELINNGQPGYGPRAGRERRAEPQADDTADGEAEPARRSVRTNDERQERRRTAQYGDEYGA